MIYLTPQQITRIFGHMKGVLHVGAHKAEERQDYIEAGFENRVWVEANPKLYSSLVHSIASQNDLVINALVSEKDGEDHNFNVASNGQSSSLLSLKIHSEIYQDIGYVSSHAMKSKSLKTILEEIPNSEMLEMINLDIQGVELRALRGLGDRINQFKLVYTEINTLELYERCDMMHDIDKFMDEKGFLKHGYKLWFRGADGWGDALYVNRSKI